MTMQRHRFENLKKYLYLTATFRNSVELIRAFRNTSGCHTAVLWNGIRIVHPADRDGLVGTILELWKDRCYTPRGFYTPRSGDQIVE